MTKLSVTDDGICFVLQCKQSTFYINHTSATSEMM